MKFKPQIKSAFGEREQSFDPEVLATHGSAKRILFGKVLPVVVLLVTMAAVAVDALMFERASNQPLGLWEVLAGSVSSLVTIRVMVAGVAFYFIATAIAFVWSGRWPKKLTSSGIAFDEAKGETEGVESLCANLYRALKATKDEVARLESKLGEKGLKYSGSVKSNISKQGDDDDG